nr:DUF6537 domain-containing protein [Paraburkholderia sp. BL10I2N1]
MLYVFRALSMWRRWRNTVLDPFSRTPERRDELALIDLYEQYADHVVAELGDTNLDACVKLLELPDRIRGYGHVRQHSMQPAREEGARLVEAISHAGAAPATGRSDLSRSSV